MDSESEKRKTKLFMGALAVVALFINSFFLGREKSSPPVTQSQPVYTPPVQSRQDDWMERETALRKQAEDKATAARKAAEDAAAERLRYLERYLNPASYTRRAGITPIAIVAVAERGGFNRAVAASIASRLKGDSTEIFSAVFSQEFVSDGLFNHACTGARQVFTRLELAKFLDVLVLARQQVRYSSNPSLENVITANMQLEVTIAPVASPDQSQSWTLTANGAGFRQNDARAMAEERLIKQIQNEPKLSLAQVLPETQNR